MRKRRWMSLLCAVMVGALCGCGADQGKKDTALDRTEDHENIEITMVLDWTPNTNHTGLYVAEEKGYFADAGLKVSIVQPPDGVRVTDEKARIPIFQGFPGFLYAVWLYFGSIRKILFQTEWRIEPLDMLFFRISI